MKKNFLKFCLVTGVILSLGGLAASCTDSKETDGPGPGPKPNPGENTYVTSEGPTPIRYVETKYYGSKTGVSVDAASVASDNIKFTCEPGEEIASYRVQLYPMAAVYNTMFNEMTQAKEEKLTTEQTEEMLLQILNNTESQQSGGKLINVKSHGSDFASYEFDYMNSELKAFEIQPDVDYLIAVQGFFDEEGKTSPGDLAVCHVKTPTKELVGNPEIAFDMIIGFTYYATTHVPNEDCKYYYFLSSVASEIQAYIDAYGEDMYRQFLCNYGGIVDVTSGEFTISAVDQNPDLDYMATAVALDANKTAAHKIFRKDFKLHQKPAETEAAECKMNAPDRIGATIIEFTMRLEKNCKSLRYLPVLKSAADEIMNGGEEVKKDYATRLFAEGSLTDGGWAVGNSEFAFDRETNTPTGEAMDKRDYQWDLSGDTEYVLLYAGRNFYNEISDLQASESFKTKPLVRDNPASCQAVMDMEITGTTRTSVTMKFTFDTEKTALYYFQYYSPNEGGKDRYGNTILAFPDIQDGSADARYGTGKYAGPEYLNWVGKSGWLYYFLDFRDPDYHLPWPNMWRADGNGVEIYTWAGFDADKTFEFAYMAEDWNGVLSEVKFCNGTTPPIKGGNNPTVDASTVKNNDGTYTITYKANDETRSMKVLFASNDGSIGSTALALEQLKAKDPSLTYNDYVDAWTEYTLAQGLPINNLSYSQNYSINNGFSVGIAVAIGGENAGDPVYSKLATQVISNGQIMTLEEYLGVKNAAAPRSSVSRSALVSKAWQGPDPIQQPNGRARMIWK